MTIPELMDDPHAPDNIFKISVCHCKSGCHSTKCPYHNHGLDCSRACLGGHEICMNGVIDKQMRVIVLAADVNMFQDDRNRQKCKQNTKMLLKHVYSVESGGGARPSGWIALLPCTTNSYYLTILYIYIKYSSCRVEACYLMATLELDEIDLS